MSRDRAAPAARLGARFVRDAEAYFAAAVFWRRHRRTAADTALALAAIARLAGHAPQPAVRAAAARLQRAARADAAREAG
jgi:hypothetical protein